jgi:hypothetical protein
MHAHQNARAHLAVCPSSSLIHLVPADSMRQCTGAKLPWQTGCCARSQDGSFSFCLRLLTGDYFDGVGATSMHRRSARVYLCAMRCSAAATKSVKVARFFRNLPSSYLGPHHRQTLSLSPAACQAAEGCPRCMSSNPRSALLPVMLLKACPRAQSAAAGLACRLRCECWWQKHGPAAPSRR